MMQIRLTPTEVRRLNEILDEGGVTSTATKINAIKFVRLARFHQKATNPAAVAASTAVPSTYSNIGLAEAKDAVEEWMAERGMTDGEGNPLPHLAAPRGRIVPWQPIKRIVVDMGSGEVTLDLDELNLRFAQGLTTMPLEEVKRLFDLWEMIKGWEDAL